MRRRSETAVAITPNPQGSIDLTRVRAGDIVRPEYYNAQSPYKGDFRLAVGAMQRGEFIPYVVNTLTSHDGARPKKGTGTYWFPYATSVEVQVPHDSPFLIPTFCDEQPSYEPLLALLEQGAQHLEPFFDHFPERNAKRKLTIVFRAWDKIQGAGLQCYAKPGDRIRFAARILPEQTTIWPSYVGEKLVTVGADSNLEIEATLIERNGQALPTPQFLFRGVVNVFGWNSLEPKTDTFENLAVEPGDVAELLRREEEEEGFVAVRNAFASANSRRFIAPWEARRGNDRYRGFDFMLPTKEGKLIGARHLMPDWPVFNDHFGPHMPIAPGIFLADMAAQHLALEVMANPATRRSFPGIFTESSMLRAAAFGAYHLKGIDQMVMPLKGGVRPGYLLASVLKDVSVERSGDVLELHAGHAQIIPVKSAAQLREPTGKAAAAISGLRVQLPALFVEPHR